MSPAPFPDLQMRDARERVVGTLDMTINRAMPGMLHGALVRSPVPHARIISIDVTEAAGRPGVIAVITAREIADLGIDPLFGWQRDDQPVLAIDRVRFEGEPVALVVGQTARAAAEATEWVDVDYEELPFVTDAAEAMAEGAPLLHDEWPANECGTWKLRRGDVDGGWAASDRIYEGVYTSPPASHVPMEPHVSLARFENGALEVWTAAQSPWMVHTCLTKMFRLPDEAVRVRVFNLGGAYGAKGGVKLEPVVACAARITGRPVRLALTRSEVFHAAAKHAASIRIRTGVKKDGTLIARQVDAVFNAGAYAVSSPIGAGQAMTRANGPYRIPNVWIDSTARYTNTVATGPFRGAMTSQVCWAYEQQLDEIAHDLGIDAAELRRRNLLAEGDTYATGETMHDVHFAELLDEVTGAIGWDKPSFTPARNKARGKGVALVIKSTLTPSRSETRMRLGRDGALTVYCSSVEMGQGASTTLAQMASAYTGVPIEQVIVPLPDTAQSPFDTTTASSRTTFSMGSALREAGASLKARMLDIASRELETATDDLLIGDGSVAPSGAPSRARSYAQLLADAGLEYLEAEGTFQTEGGMRTLDRSTGQGIASIHWHEGAVAVEVEVDLETGRIEILRCHGSCYAGRVISAVRVRQQNEGNIIFGLGQALFEELIYDSGQLVNPNLSDYMIPSILDAPIELTSSAIESSDPEADVHGVGEMTIPCLAPAIANALFDAAGIRLRDLPMTAESVLRALSDKERAGRP